MTKPNRQAKRKTEPKVGLFWLFNDELIIDGTPLDQAEAWGQYRNDPRSHEELWSEYQRINRVSRDGQYDEWPRGRALYDTISQRFFLYADVCILQKRGLVKKILRELGLPFDTTARTDAHYSCSRACLGVPNTRH